jgi:uncharacterized protein YjbI with pentapeptide repeats
MLDLPVQSWRETSRQLQANQRCRLRKTDLRGNKETRREGKDSALKYARCRFTVLLYCQGGADFLNANLFEEAKFEGANLFRANLKYANLERAILNQASFKMRSPICKTDRLNLKGIWKEQIWDLPIWKSR